VEENDKDDEFEEFVAELGSALEEYSGIDDNIATNMTIEQDWEENLVSSGVALHCLNELRVSVFHHQNPDLLCHIGQCTLAVEKASSKSMKQTKL